MSESGTELSRPADDHHLDFLADRHSDPRDATQFPVVMPGRGGEIRTGRILDDAGKPDRQMCRPYPPMMDKMDVRPGEFGDATEALPEI